MSTDPLATGPTTTGPTGRHPVNISHLVMGLAFAGLLVIWALIVGDVVESDHIGPLLGVPWVLAGAIGLVAAVLAGRQKRYADTPAYAEPTPYTTTDTEEIR